MTNRAWHFMTADRRLRYDDNRLVEAGQTLTVDTTDRPLELCEWGMHWSEDILDALKYAPGLTLSRVEWGGESRHGDDKGCSSERTAVEIHDVTDLVCAWARWAAQQVLHLWDAPEVVVAFLETGEAARAADAADAARAARAAYAADAAAYAAYAADAAYAAARAARAADAAYAAYAADAAYAAAGAARAADAAYAAYAMQDKQREKFLELLATRFVCLAGEE